MNKDARYGCEIAAFDICRAKAMHDLFVQISVSFISLSLVSKP